MKKQVVSLTLMLSAMLSFAQSSSKAYIDDDNEDFFFDFWGTIHMRAPIVGYREKVKGNYEAAIKAFTRGAELGDLNSVYEIGFAYRFGNGVEQSDNESFKWMLKAAKREHRAAQQAVANAYSVGRGVEKDLILAVAWYEIASTEANNSSQYVAIAKHNSAIFQKQLNEKDVFRAKTIARICLITNYVQCE